MLRQFLLIGAAAAGLMASAPALAAQDFLVIVNEANETEAISRNDLAQIFLKRTTEWSNGSPVVPVDLTESSPVREAFSQSVHGRPVSAMKAHWQRQIFSGRGVPPVEKAAESEVIEYVRANRNAVGYVRNGSSLGSGVRTLRILN